MVNKFPIVVLVATFGLMAVAQAADLYKWTDDKGVLHYSDTPPPGHADATRVRVKSGVSDESAPPAAATAVAEADKPKDAAKPNPPAPAPMDRNTACEQARSNLNLLQSKYAVADASGKPLDDKTRQTLTDQAKQTVSDCGKP
jgi:hypothetical protein